MEFGPKEHIKKKCIGKGTNEGDPSTNKANQEIKVNPTGAEKAQSPQDTPAQENEEQVDIPPPNKEAGEAIQNEAN